MVTKDEYLKMIREAYEQDEYLDDYIDDWNHHKDSKLEYMKSKSEKIKNKLLSEDVLPCINATHIKKADIEKIIYKSQKIIVGNFMIVSAFETSIDSFKIVLYEKVFKTVSGIPCNMEKKINIAKDDRFKGRPWVKHFNGIWGAKVSSKDYIDIIKWLQVVENLTCFL